MGQIFTTSSGSKTLVPDIVICNSRQIIDLVELKYLPRTQPTFRKDMETLRAIAANRSELQVANSRYRGDRSKAKAYSIASNALFVWAGVHREAVSNDASSALFNNGVPELEGCFLELHAETSDTGPPRIFRDAAKLTGDIKRCHALINYMLNRWESFTRFLESGAVPMENNAAERVLKYYRSTSRI